MDSADDKVRDAKHSAAVMDMVRNSYETGNARGFKDGKKLGFGYGVSIGTLFWFVVIMSYLMLSGCAPVAEVAAGYEVGGNTTGRQPSAHIYLGLETSARGPLRGSCGLYHLSHVRDGTPFNNRAETWSDQVRCAVRYTWSDR